MAWIDSDWTIIVNAGAFRQIIHFVLDSLDDELSVIPEVVGGLFDDLMTLFDFVKEQIDPNKATAAGTLLDFERLFRCVPAVGDSIQTRRARVVSAIRSTGDLNCSYFYRIADSLGYAIDSGEKWLHVSEGDYSPFRADYGRADIDRVYDAITGSSQYTVVVNGTGVETDYDLQYRFNKQILAGIEIIYINS